MRGEVKSRTVQKGDGADGEEDETSEIGETSGSENVAALVVYPIPLGIRVMKVVIRFCVIK